MVTGAQLLALAETRLGEKYVNVQVPKDNRNWHGPWDCAEFASWLVYQAVGKLYGCVDDAADPALADAYSGAWVRDAVAGKVNQITQSEANGIPGAVLIRKPPAPGKMGHIAIADGHGGTVEAAGINLGVRRDKVEGRLWNYVVTIPELAYSSTGYVVATAPLPYLLTLETPNIKSSLVRRPTCASRQGLRSREDRRRIRAAHRCGSRSIPGDEPPGRGWHLRTSHREETRRGVAGALVGSSRRSCPPSKAQPISWPTSCGG